MKRAIITVAAIAVAAATSGAPALADGTTFTCGGNTRLTVHSQPPEAVISGATGDFAISLPRRTSQPFWAVFAVGGAGHCRAAPCAEVDQGGNGVHSAVYVLEPGQPVTCEEN